MAQAWFIAKFNVTVNYPNFPFATRTSAIDESQLAANGARWRSVELTNRLIYKIVASNAVLNAVANLANVKRLPTDLLDSPLSDLTANQRQAIRDELIDQGYTLAEINAQFPNLANATLRQVLRYMARTRTLPAFDIPTLAVIASDKPEDVRACDSVDEVESAVT